MDRAEPLGSDGGRDDLLFERLLRQDSEPLGEQCAVPYPRGSPTRVGLLRVT